MTTTTPKGHMALTAFMLAPGYYTDSWRMEGSRSEELAYIDLITDLAKMCEKAKLDAIFIADVVSARPILQANIKFTGFYEPLTTCALLAGLTKNIGLIATSSTSFSDPFVLARQLSGIDSLSGGRAGWNLVTSTDGGENFGLDEMPPPADRYRRATEFFHVVTGLWDSWSDEAVINNRETGWWADPEKLRAIDHEGEFFKVKGPLNMRRSPQGRPVIVQAGSSPAGIELGALSGDAIYTAQPEKSRAIEFYNTIKAKAVENGRREDQIKVIAGILPILGDTMEEAQALADKLASNINFEMGRKQVEESFRVDFSDLGLDDPVPAERLPENPLNGSRYEIYRRHVQEDNWTVRDIIVESHRSGAHLWAMGTPETVADLMIEWFEDGACDGFSLNPAFMPGGLALIFEKLVPELARRGYFRTEYTGSTLREHWGLDRPGAWDTK